MSSADLYARIERGWDVCDTLMRTRDPKAGQTEDFWIELLHDYERAVDKERMWHLSPSSDDSPLTRSSDTRPMAQPSLL